MISGVRLHQDDYSAWRAIIVAGDAEAASDVPYVATDAAMDDAVDVGFGRVTTDLAQTSTCKCQR
jgi:hypothetical protein